jgi:aminoglycoside phosphotransferase (APT) family kinase protein
VSGHDHLVGPLTAALREAGLVDPTVTVTGVASAGATRSTVFLDIHSGDDVVQAVAQIRPMVDDTPLAPAEAKLLTLAASAGVPVPEVIAVTDHMGGEPADVLVTSRIGGLSIPRHILRSLPDRAAGEALAVQCGTALARIHNVPLDEVPHSLVRLDAAAPHAHYCRLRDEALSVLPTHHPAIRWGINELRRNPPSAPQDLALVHADFRNGNILIDDGQLTAVLDWELAHVGDPMEDLAWMCLRMWRFGNDDLPCGGFGSIEALREGYESEGGVWREDAFWWWLAARSAWWATGLAHQGAAFLSGESDSLVHAASGRRVAELEYDLLTLLRTQER